MLRTPTLDVHVHICGHGAGLLTNAPKRSVVDPVCDAPCGRPDLRRDVAARPTVKDGEDHVPSVLKRTVVG